MTQLQANRLYAGYGDARILDGIDISFAPGRITALVGPNGCGKSTLLKTIGRILRPQAGSVLLDGKAVHALPTRQLASRMGLLPQGPVAPGGLIVRELVAQGRFPHQTLLQQWSKEDEDAVQTAMERANIAHLALQPVDGLSGGQRQRAWIAMVLAQQTEIILLDEPTTFLDLKVQIDLMDILADLAHGQGRTLVVVLHELNLAATYADSMIMIRDGRVLAEGEVEDVFTPANLQRVFDLDAQVIRDPESQRLVCIPRRRQVSR